MDAPKCASIKFKSFGDTKQLEIVIYELDSSNPLGTNLLWSTRKNTNGEWTIEQFSIPASGEFCLEIVTSSISDNDEGRDHRTRAHRSANKAVCGSLGQGLYEYFEIDWINVSDTDCQPNLSCDFDQSTCGFDMRTNESPEFFNTTRGRMKEQALNLKFGEELSATVFENGCLELWHNSRGQLALRNNGLQSARSDFKSGYHQVKDFQISIF